MHHVGREHSPPQEASEDAIQAVLSQDHERLERQFQSILAEASDGDPIALREAWRTFESDLLHHFDDEEVHILPAFARQRPADARALVDEHERIRARLTKLGVDLDLHCLPAERIADLVASLRAHARHEDDLLYPWAAHRLGETASERVRTALSKTEETHMGNPEEWQFDPERSHLHFSLRHIVVHEIRGQFRKWGGTIALDGADLTKARARVWIDLASVDTGEPERDAQIRSSEFFDVEHFPQAVFSSAEIRLPQPGNPIVKGSLALHGFLEDVEVEITSHNQVTDPKNVDRMSYEIKTRIDRRKFGLRWNQDLDVGGVVIGDQIEIVARVEAVRAKRAP
jgi:polyisoprenoid-binding protein YceI